MSVVLDRPTNVAVTAVSSSAVEVSWEVSVFSVTINFESMECCIMIMYEVFNV